MIINDNRAFDVAVVFREIEVGKCFEYEDNFYIKTQINMAFNFTTKQEKFIEDCSVITPIVVELNILE